MVVRVAGATTILDFKKTTLIGVLIVEKRDVLVNTIMIQDEEDLDNPLFQPHRLVPISHPMKVNISDDKDIAMKIEEAEEPRGTAQNHVSIVEVLRSSQNLQRESQTSFHPSGFNTVQMATGFNQVRRGHGPKCIIHEGAQITYCVK
jgi:hypothetical protein